MRLSFGGLALGRVTVVIGHYSVRRGAACAAADMEPL
jgi:hypothetical protein